ncbi:MAG TPA: hypothetical protein VFE05_01165 [Longimicrobiaceae bacterium]|jgi:hypothetical protein|nr:hypothetical protein [Longimicrobiaceae bacterium]
MTKSRWGWLGGWALAVLLVVVMGNVAAARLLRGPEVAFPPVGRVTRLLVIGAGGKDTLRDVREPAEIARVLSFVDARRTSWTAPWYGVPVPRVRAELYDGGTFKGSFGVGPNFFETVRQGAFVSRPAGRPEVDSILGLLRVPPEAMKARRPSSDAQQH